MSDMALPAPSAERRRQLLRAIGLTPWVLRDQPQSVGRAAHPAHDAMATSLPIGAPMACAVVLPAACTTQELDLIGRALYSAGAVIARAPRLEVDAGRASLRDLPEARAYLVFGDAQAHALGRALSAERQQRVAIVLADTPMQLRASGAAKRRLWHALRELRRATRDIGGV